MTKSVSVGLGEDLSTSDRRRSRWGPSDFYPDEAPVTDVSVEAFRDRAAPRDQRHSSGGSSRTPAT